ncbi:oligosaccharide flippase family protein [Saccharicrinis aurantiacus]|uniref:oligosaccharide flippase family protein n=1 Tax=Saccharicrinis aurantiacus TaxID=1849719 RepID=UPI00249200C8|nr:oligosaccharide flippase family protein [Saccharicrinis aurantiacus]
MLTKIKLLISDHKSLLSNFGYLSILQIVTMLLPLATYPYLVQTLGLEIWGKVIFAQVICNYFAIFIRFGFQLSATKEVSIHRDSAPILSRIVSSVLIIRTLLFVTSFLILFIIVACIPSFWEDKALYFLSFLFCINEWLFPIWYFQGIERMKYVTFISLTSKLIFFCLIFVFIKTESDYLYVPLLNGIGVLFGGIVALYIIFIKHKVAFKFQAKSVLLKYFNESLPLFGSMAVISIRDNFNVIFIKLFLGSSEVAIYDLGIKIMNIIKVFITLINTATYPKIMREKNIKFLKKMVFVVFVGMFVSLLISLFFLSDFIKFVGGGQMKNALPLIRLLLLVPLIIILRIYPDKIIEMYGRYKIYAIGNIITVIFYLSLIGLGYLFGFVSHVMFFGVVVVLTYLFETIYRFFKIKNIIQNE